MARRCALCGKKAMVAVVRKKLRGKYNPTCKKKKYPNLQWVTLNSGKRVKACAKCIKTMHKNRLSKKKAKVREEVARSKKEAEKKPEKKTVKSSKKIKTVKKGKKTK